MELVKYSVVYMDHPCRLHMYQRFKISSPNRRTSTCRDLSLSPFLSIPIRRSIIFLNISNSSTSLNGFCNLIERREVVLVGCLGKVTDLSNVDDGIAEIILDT